MSHPNNRFSIVIGEVQPPTVARVPFTSIHIAWRATVEGQEYGCALDQPVEPADDMPTRQVNERTAIMKGLEVIVLNALDTLRRIDGVPNLAEYAAAEAELMADPDFRAATPAQRDHRVRKLACERRQP